MICPMERGNSDNKVMKSNHTTMHTHTRNVLGKMKKVLLLCIAIALTGGLAKAQTTVTIGTGTTTTYQLPVNNFYNYTYSQQLYTAAEIGAGGVPHEITSVSYMYAYSSATTAKANCTIYMANVPRTSFTSTTDWVPYSQLTRVYTGSMNFSAGVGTWTTFNLQTPFTYDGTSSLLICVHDNSGSYNSSSYVLYGSACSNQALHCYNDGSSYVITGATPTLNGSTPTAYLASVKSNLRMVMNPVGCRGITNLAVSGSTVTWTELGNATQWEVEYGPQGFTQGSAAGTVVTVNTTSYNLTGLQAGNVYDVYVRSVCGPNDYSRWKKTSVLYGVTFCGGNGTRANPYQICSEQDLRDLARYVNAGVSFSGIYFRQMVDITLAQGTFTPVGQAASTPFSGTYFGGNHFVSNLVMANNTSSLRGLFGAVRGGYIDSLTIDGTITGGDSTGAIAGSIVNSTVRNCVNNAYVMGAYYRHGGIVGAAGNSRIENCVNNGALLGSQYYHAGIAGIAYNGTVIRKCVNNGVISSSSYYAGGIVGYATGASTSSRTEIHSCVNKAQVIGTYYTGGIVGDAYNFCLIDSSTNMSEVAGTYNVGGIAGRMYNNGNIVRRCSNRALVSNGTGSYTGGIVGYCYGSSANYNYIEYCVNSGPVSSYSSYIGGIAGYLYYSYLQYCSNSADVDNHSTSSYTGGLCGYATTYGYIRYSVNGGLVTSGGSNVGGITGYSYGSSYTTYCLNVNNAKSTNASATNVAAIAGTGIVSNCYYDNQMCPTGLLYGTTAATTEGKPTTQLVGTGITIPSTSYFTMSNNMYPIPNGITDSIGAKLASTPIFLTGGQTIAAVDTNFTVGTTNNVRWLSDNPTLVSVAGANATVNPATIAMVRMSGITQDSLVKHIDIRVLSMPSFCGGSGTQADPYLICNPATLDSLADIVNLGINCQGIYFKVVRDLDMSGFSPWNPIGASAGTPFCGHFDGNNKVISNVNINNSTQYQGLFGYVLGQSAASPAEVHHLTLRGRIVGGSYTGGVVGYANYAKLYKLTNYATVGSTSYTYQGGIAGYCYFNCRIDSCENHGAVSGAGYTGGIAGGLYEYGSIRNTKNYANVTASYYSGGIVGYEYYYDTLVNCVNEGNVATSSYSVGGIAGYKNYYGYIQNCRNSGDVTGTYNVGGIVGYLYYYNILQNCENTGDVTATQYYVGGVVGYYYSGNSSLTSTYEINSCTNRGDVIGTYYIGGIAGYGYGCRIRFCNNYGDVTASSYATGGIIGYCYYYSLVSGSNNYGNVTSTYVGTSVATTAYGTGGIVGCFSYGTTVSNIATIDSCNNYGDITAASNMTGGIVGESYYYSGSTKKCNNYGNVHGTNYVGGITGFHQGTSTSTASYAPYIITCANAGNVSGTDYIGGIVGRLGYTTSGYNAYAQECANIGSVSGTNYVGGICGYNYGYSSYPSYVRGCLNAGMVKASNYGGGICGYSASTSNAYNQYNINAGYLECSGTYKGGIDGYSNAPSNCYYDTLMCPMPNWYYGNNNATYARRTSYLTDGLFNPSPTYFMTERDMYPRPLSLRNNTIAILAATPVFLDETNPTNHVDNVNSCFSVCTNYGVNWHSTNPAVASITGNVGVPLMVDTVTAVAVKDSIHKNVHLNVVALPQISTTFTYNRSPLNDTTGRRISIRPTTNQYSNGCTFFSNSLPRGLSLNDSTGEISGIVYDELHDTIEVRAVCSGCFIAQAIIPYNIYPEAPCMYDSLRLPAGFTWYYDSIMRFPVQNNIIYADQRPMWVYTRMNGRLQPYLIQPKPVPMAHISGDTTVCQGGTARLMIVFNGTAPYYYRITGDTQDRVSNSDTAYITVAPNVTTYYHLTYLRFEVCEAIPGNLTGRALVNICGEQSLCNGDSVVFTSGTWFTNSSYTTPVPGNVAHPTSNTMYYNRDDGTSLNAIVHPRPTATIPNGSDSICNGDCINLTITFTGTAPFHYRLTGDTVDRVCNSNSETLRLCPSGSIVYRVLSVGDVYCDGQYQDRNGVYDVKVCTTPIICVGDTVVLPSNRIWYYDRYYTNPVGDTIVTPTVTTTYYTPDITYDDTVNFSYTGSVQQFPVPPGLDSISFQVWGARGGDGRYDYLSADGGKGGFAEGRMRVTYGDVLYIYVGGAGRPGLSGQLGAPVQGGFNGGGNSGYNGSSNYNNGGGSGGGATDIRVNGTTYNHRVIVAGGGGGGGNSWQNSAATGGYGGGATGGDGASGGTAGAAVGSNTWGSPGGGGSLTAGGVAGSYGGYTGSAGAFGLGGSGWQSNNYSAGGGGGGGWYGGGPGSQGNSAGSGGGGGGSGFVYVPGVTVPGTYQLTSSRYLGNARTVAGNTSFPAPNGGTETGHNGNGFARVMYFSDSILYPATTFTVRVNPKATATIHGLDTTCDSTPARVQMTFTGTAPFVYRLSGDTTDRVSYNYTQTLYMTPDTLSTYRITMLYDANCVSGRAQFTGIGIVYRCGQLVVCEGDSVSLPQGYYWYRDRQLTRRMYITDLLPRRTATYYGVPVHGGNTYELTIVIKPHPTARFYTGNTTICNGDSAYLGIVFTGTAPYTYRLTGDVADRMSWYDTAIVPVCPSQTSRYNITMLYDTLCSGIIPLPQNEITVEICGQRLVCAGDTVHLPSGVWFYDSLATRPVPPNNVVTIDSTTTFYLAGEMAYDFSYTGSTQLFQVPASCYALKLEVWGAQGGYRTTPTNGGKGGYSVGYVNHLGAFANANLFVNVGGFGGSGSTNTNTVVPGGWNGGGYRYGYHGGGGATDIALDGTAGSTAWNTADHLYSRIIVAGGGGSDGSSSYGGSYGGGPTGGDASGGCTYNSYCGYGGRQTYSGYSTAYTTTSQTTTGLSGTTATYWYGGFGFGGGGTYYSSGYGGAGGGGWYGGSGTCPDGSVDDDRGGGGGSGFVWDASSASSVPQGYTPTAAFYLDNAQTIAGNSSFPDTTGIGTETGHEGNGFARITVYSTGTYTVTVDRRPTGTISVSDTACGNNGVYLRLNFTGAPPFTYRVTGDTADRVCYGYSDSVYVQPAMIQAFRITRLYDNHCTAQPADYAGLATVEVCRQTMLCHGDTLFLDTTRNWFSDPLMLNPISRIQIPDTTTVYYTNTVRTHTAVVNEHPTATILTPDTSICGGSACLRIHFTGTAPFTYRITGDSTDRVSYFNDDVVCITPTNTGVYGVTSLYDAYCTGDPSTYVHTMIITVCDQMIVCAGDSVVLPAGAQWYYDGALTRPVPNNIANPTVTTNYYMEATTDFTYTGSVQRYVVPNGVTQLDLQVWGAEGGKGCSSSSSFYAGGKGGYSEGTMPVNPGDTLLVYVGGRGKDADGTTTTGTTYPGGWNGGGDAGIHSYSSAYQGGSGGGGTDIRVNSTALGARGIVAGGGGGGGYSYVGGEGGGTAGIAGGNGGAVNYYGQGGTQGAGGSGSTGGSYAYGGGTYDVNGQSGSFGQGGNGGSGSSACGGGGGGGGWYGGGGGKSGYYTSCYPGGGGSGFVYTSANGACTLPSSYYMSNARTMVGNTSFPSPTGGTETGHQGNGYARIHGAAVYTVVVNTPPKASITTGTTRVCDSATHNAVNITITFTGTAPFTYRVTGDVVDRVTNNGSETITIYPTVSGTYQVTYLKDYYCEALPIDLQGVRTVLVCDQPIICAEDQVTLPNGTWYHDVLLTRPVGGRTVNPAMTTTYYDQDTNAFTVTVRPRPTASISGRASVCDQQDSATLTIRFTGTLPITYRLSGERVNRTANNYTETINVHPRRTTTYTITQVSDVFCVGRASDLVGNAVVAVCDTITHCASDTIYLPAGTWYYDSLLTIPVGGNMVFPDSNTTYYKALSAGEDTTFTYTGAVQTYTVPAGVDSVLLQVWGAQGGDGGPTNYGGKGGYSHGIMRVTAGDVLYVYVGGQGQGTSSTTSGTGLTNGGWNGGGNGYQSGTARSAGGGASDIRVGGQTLNHRVIVAGGGGGNIYFNGNTYYAGAGGGTNGQAGTGSAGAASSTSGGTQAGPGNNAGTYSNFSNATFGIGSSATTTGSTVCGGGGGWYGGGNGNAASGGSGFVYTSANAQCQAPAAYMLTNAQTIAGNLSFVAPDSTTETGHAGNGAARIIAYGQSGDFEPYTVNIYPKPMATIYGGDSICFGQLTQLVIDFVGVPPFVYRLSGETQNRVCNGFTDTLYVSPTASNAYRLDMMYDYYCEARAVDLQGVANVIVCDQPVICEGQAVQLDPNRVWYLDHMLTYPLPSTSVTPTQTTTYYSAEGSYTVTVKPRPRATINTQVLDICDSQTVSVVINFIGTPPFVYRLNGDTADRVCNNNMEFLTFMPMGSAIYRMTSLYDALCDATFLDMSGSVKVNYCGEKVICSGDVVELPAGRWYLDSACTIPLPSNSVMPNTTTTYYRHLGDTNQDFHFVADTQIFVVPRGVDSVFMQVWGAEGGKGSYSSASSLYNGGKGGYAEGYMAVTPGDVLYVLVGGKGTDANGSTTTGVAYPGGFNGGGDAGTHTYSGTYQGGGGGGGTDIRVGTNSVNHRVIVAGGGGGGAYSYVGGYGGGTTGQAGGNGGAATYYGQGGTQGAGGSGSTNGTAYGTVAASNVNGQTGLFGQGGHGGEGTSCTGGAGGGGGWWGGGGGKSGSSTTCYPGGGGSGFIWVAGATTPAAYAVPQAYYLNNARTVAGNVSMPDITGNGTETGHEGNGFARIFYPRDVVESFTVIVNRGYSQTFFDTIGYGESYNFCGVSYTRPGTYSANLYTEKGCDSTLILNLVQLDSVAKDTTIAICAFETLDFRGTIYDSTGVYINKKPHAQACDTTYTIYLTVKDTAFRYIDTVICSNDTIFVGDTMFNETGFYRQYLQTDLGCDSMVVLNLVVQDTIWDLRDSLACYETMVEFFDTVLDHTMPGTYTYVAKTIHGCDSIIRLNLQFRPRIDTIIYDTFCENSRYFFNDEFRNATGIYYDTLTSELCNCDSIIELHLKRLLYPVVQLIDSGAYCKNDSLVLLVQTDANSIIWETYPVDTSMNRFRNMARIRVAPKVHTFYTVTVDHYPHNCVSTAQIFVKPPDTLQAIVRANPSVVDLPNTQIQFTDVSMGTIVTNKWILDDLVRENTPSVYYTTAPEDDSVRVILIVSDTNTCYDTTTLVVPIRRGEIWAPSAFTPDNHDGNAANETFKISGLNVTEFEIHIYSRAGQLVYESDDINFVWDGTHNGNKCQPGSYVYIIKYRLQSHPDRLETKTGSVLLIR